MLNPSTADHKKNDNTIRRVLRFSGDWGFDIVVVVNMYAIRARDPKVMKAALKISPVDAMGEDNPFWVRHWMKRADRIVVGWGNNAKVHPDDIILAYPNAYCLGLTKSLQPKHPLMVKADHITRRYEDEYSDATS